MKIKISLIVALIAIVVSCSGQNRIPWGNWTWLMGEWVGEGSGQPGQGEGTFSFNHDLNKNILVRRSHSEYPATENNPATIHDDLLIVYSDENKMPSKAIYFDNERHTINYSISYAETSIILTSNRAQGGPVYRLTYLKLDDETANIKFEMSQDGQTYKTYIEGKSKKKH